MIHGKSGRESLEALLSRIMDGQRAGGLADALMEHYGTLYSLVESLHLYDGEPPIPESIRVLLSMTPQLHRMRELERLGPHVLLDSLDAAGRYASTLYIGAQNEQLYILCLDEQYRLIDSCLVSEGSLNEVPVYLRQVMQKALHCGARAIIMCHNHPSGWMFFSESDVAATRAILSLCAKMQISLIDHLLVARERVTSMRSRVYIPDDMWRASGPMVLPNAQWRHPQVDKDPTS